MKVRFNGYFTIFTLFLSLALLDLMILRNIFYDMMIHKTFLPESLFGSYIILLLSFRFRNKIIVGSFSFIFDRLNNELSYYKLIPILFINHLFKNDYYYKYESFDGEFGETVYKVSYSLKSLKNLLEVHKISNRTLTKLIKSAIFLHLKDGNNEELSLFKEFGFKIEIKRSPDNKEYIKDYNYSVILLKDCANEWE